MMKYFKGQNDQVYAYESDGSQDEFIQLGLTLITEQEADELRNPPKTLDEIKAEKIIGVDADVDTIYAAAIGNRGPEYMDAETAAQAYKDAGYDGTVPPGVQSWADAKGWTAQQAADDILAAALQLNTAKLAIRAERLLRKEQIRTAADADAIDTIMASWAAFVVQIKAQLGLA